MAHEGQRFEAPDGNTLRLVRISDELLEMEAGYSGEGTVHRMGGDGPARVKWQVRPALQTARFFVELYEGVPMQDPAAFLARYAAEFRLADG